MVIRNNNFGVATSNNDKDFELEIFEDDPKDAEDVIARNILKKEQNGRTDNQTD